MTAGTEWRQAYEERARAWWTEERLTELTGGKSLPVLPDRAPCLLRAMGVLDSHAHIHPSRVRKFRQINHMLSFLEPALEELQAPSIQLIDAGCGRSALGFLVAWWFADRGVSAQVLGIDRSDPVINGCRERAQGLPMAFATADLAEVDLASVWRDVFGSSLSLDGLISLHACDTATDAALRLALQHKARFFAVAPCCQAELSRKWAAAAGGPLSAVTDNPHLRRTLAATVTDAMRAELMRAAGYTVRAVEFVEAHHTPKNTLIYGHRTGGAHPLTGYDRLAAATGGHGIAFGESVRAMEAP